MFKKLTYGFLLIFVVLVFTMCEEKGCNNLTFSEIPLFRQGDTLIYTIDNDRKDTFRVDTLRYGYFTTGMARTCYQILNYEIKRVNHLMTDTACFNLITVEEDAESGLHMWLDNPGGIERFYLHYSEDTLYKNKSIGDKNYTSVYFYASKTSKTNCRNLYFNHQYGVLSIEVNNHLVYLSEIRPKR